MKQPSERDWKEALDLIQALQQRLSSADHTSSYVNRELIQRSIDLLEQYGRGGPTFPV